MPPRKIKEGLYSKTTTSTRTNMLKFCSLAMKGFFIELRKDSDLNIFRR